MCVAAVKFGRMSKKQREKVEEEVNFHQTQNRMRGSSGSGTSPDPWQGPDSTGSGETTCPVYPGVTPSNAGPGGQFPGQYPGHTELGPQYPGHTPNQNPFYGAGAGAGAGQPGGGGGPPQFDEFVDSTTPNTTTPFDTRGGLGQDTDTPQHLQPGQSGH